MYKKFYKNKKILITGGSGFTGSWLILYFLLHGAKIYGYSKNPPFKKSLFETLNLKQKITNEPKKHLTKEYTFFMEKSLSEIYVRKKCYF